jgi:NAD(P)-dependent dehydrogenase (short-subunit alcohol dehydrogenase family)
MTFATGKHALITGGGTGIGAGAARALAAAGASVSLIGRRQELLDAVAAETGGKAIVCDVTDPEAQARAFAEAREAFGPLDYVILNAGIGDSRPFLRTKRERDHRH